MVWGMPLAMLLGLLLLLKINDACHQEAYTLEMSSNYGGAWCVIGRLSFCMA